MDFQSFFLNYGLLILLGALLVFMFWSSSRRMKKQRIEQAEKARQTVPGAEVLLQGGLYGTIVEFDPDNLDQPAIVEIAPGVDIKVHSQSILRVITPADEVDEIEEDDEFDEIVDGFHAEHDDSAPAAVEAADVTDKSVNEPVAADADADAEQRDGDTKPGA